MMRRSSPASTSRSGVTVIEVMITVVVGLTVMGAVTMTTSTNTRALQNGGVISALQARSTRVLERIVRELALADLDSLAGFPVSPAFTNGITYDVPIDVSTATGDVTWQTNRVEWRQDPADPDDGLDNDGDGLIDEGRVVLITDFGGANQRDTILSKGVAEYAEGEVANGNDDNGNVLIDERGLCFEFDGTNMTIRLTLEKSGNQALLNQHSVTTMVRLRN